MRFVRNDVCFSKIAFFDYSPQKDAGFRSECFVAFMNE